MRGIESSTESGARVLAVVEVKGVVLQELRRVAQRLPPPRRHLYNVVGEPRLGDEKPPHRLNEGELLVIGWFSVDSAEPVGTSTEWRGGCLKTENDAKNLGSWGDYPCECRGVRPRARRSDRPRVT